MSVPKQTQHVHLVKTLYRKILKEQLNWCIGREYWFSEAAKTRNLFDKYRNESDMGIVNTQIGKAKQWLIDNRHPEPYIPPNQAGGSSFQRNAAPPIEVLEKSDLPDTSHSHHHH